MSPLSKVETGRGCLQVMLAFKWNKHGVMNKIGLLSCCHEFAHLLLENIRIGFFPTYTNITFYFSCIRMTDEKYPILGFFKFI
jgi:hypothetical protein